MNSLQSQTTSNVLMQPVEYPANSDPQTVVIQYALPESTNRENTSRDSSRTPSTSSSVLSSPTRMPASAHVSLSRTPPTKRASSLKSSPRRFLSLLGVIESPSKSPPSEDSFPTSPQQGTNQPETSYLPPLQLPASRTTAQASSRTLSATANTSTLSSTTASVSFLLSAATTTSVAASTALSSSLASLTTTTSTSLSSSATSSSTNQTVQTSPTTTLNCFLRPDQMADRFCTALLSEGVKHNNCSIYLPFLDVNYKKCVKLEINNKITLYTPLEVAILWGWKEAVYTLIKRGSSLTTSSLGAPVWKYLEYPQQPGTRTPFFSEKEREELLHIMPVEVATSFDFLLYLYTNKQLHYAEICLTKAIESNPKPQWWNTPKQASEIIFLAIQHGQEKLCEKIIETGKASGNYIDTKSMLSLMDLIIQKRLFSLATALAKAN